MSSHGRVQNTFGVVSWGSLTSHGYRSVRISGHAYFVHRLVAAAFLLSPPDPDHWQVNHLDGNGLNNHRMNLQYVTPGENNKHAWAINLNRRHVSSKLGAAVEWRRLGDDSWSHCESQGEAARRLGVWQSCVSRCCRGLAKSCRGCQDGDLFEFRSAVGPFSTPGKAVASEDWQAAIYPFHTSVPIANLMVSNQGRVSHLLPTRQIVTFGTQTKNGYFAVQKAGQFMLVHRLVVATFLGQPHSAELQVNHKDLDRGNNRVENLEYVTAAENRKHAVLQREGRERKAGVCKPVQVRLKANGEVWKDFNSLKEAASHLGIGAADISRLCSGRRIDEMWECRYTVHESFPGEEWRCVVLDRARRPGP